MTFLLVATITAGHHWYGYFSGASLWHKRLMMFRYWGCSSSDAFCRCLMNVWKLLSEGTDVGRNMGSCASPVRWKIGHVPVVTVWSAAFLLTGVVFDIGIPLMQRLI